MATQPPSDGFGEADLTRTVWPASAQSLIKQIGSLYTAMGRPNDAQQWRAKLQPK